MAAHDKSLSEDVKSWNWKDVPVNNAFGYYREGICAAFMPLCADLHTNARRDFRFSIRSHLIDDSRLNIVRAKQHTVSRGHKQIEASPDACYYLNLQHGGVCRVRQGSHEMALASGDLGIFDSEQAMELNHDQHPHLAVASIMVPKAKLHPRIDAQALSSISRPTLLSSDPELGQLATNLANSMVASATNGQNQRAEKLQNMLFDIVAEILTSQTKRQPVNSNNARRLRIQHIIDKYCRKPGFNLQQCSSLLSLSTRSIQRTLSNEHTNFSQTLIAARLAYAVRALENPLLAESPINTIALTSGFRDPAHFSKVFKHHYGLTPGEWRERRLSN